MLFKSNIGYIVLSVLSSSQHVLAREKWLERDNRAVFLYPRRFGQEQPAVLQKIGAACPGEVCGNLAGQAVTPLLAAQGECTQQDLADAIIDASKQFDAATQANMIALAIEYRQVEKNTPPDFTTNPPALRNSVFCQKAPKNPELNGLIQAQDPDNDPNLFFDPALKATVLKGSQANTAAFGGAAAPAPAATTVSTTATATTTALPDTTSAVSVPCTTEIFVTVTVSATNPDATGDATIISAGDPAPSSTTDIVATPAPTGNIGNFGTCSVPQIEFGVGFDGRKETSAQPVDKASYNHGSAQNIGIITQFICDTLTNTCGADQTAKDTCATAKVAAAAAAVGTGAQADAFNAVFGITTTFVNIASVDNQGNVVPGTGNGAVTATPANVVSGNTGGIGDFGKCSIPQIEFAAGFDGRRETSFRPVDSASFNHGSAQNIAIITRFICDTLTNSCAADATAKTTCATAQDTAVAAATNTGAQADAFNAVFGIQTNFNDVTPIDDQGHVVGGSNAGTANTPAANVPPTTTAPAQAGPTDTTAPASSTSGNLQAFSGALGGVTAPVVTALADGTFQVTGNATFNDKRNALVRSCDVQNNQCANAANASGNSNGFTVSACNAQQQQCIAEASSV